MNRERKHILIGGLLVLLAPLAGIGQNQLHMTQYMLHQPFVNPAGISSYDNINAALLYKKQWVGFDGAPTFQGFNVNMPIGAGSSTVGLMAFNDALGVTRKSRVGGTYAYRFGVSEQSMLSFGLTADLTMIQANYGELRLQDETDPVYNNNTPNVMLPGFSFGTYYFADGYYAGFSIPDLVQNDIRWEDGYTGHTEFKPWKSHYYFHGGTEFEVGDSLKVQPSVMVKATRSVPVQVDLNAQLLYQERYGFGLSYRTKRVVAALLNYRITDEFRLGYAYDMNLTDLRDHSYGSHEIVLIFDSIQKKRQAKINVPRF